MRRQLVLRKETLTELSADQLALVAGAAATLPDGACVGALITKALDCESNISPCTTHTCP